MFRISFVEGRYFSDSKLVFEEPLSRCVQLLGVSLRVVSTELSHLQASQFDDRRTWFYP